METINIPRCACRGPCGAAIPARQGRTDRTAETRRKETRIEHPSPLGVNEERGRYV